MQEARVLILAIGAVLVGLGALGYAALSRQRTGRPTPGHLGVR